MCLVSNGSLCVANWRLANTTYSQTLKLWRLQTLFTWPSSFLLIFLFFNLISHSSLTAPLFQSHSFIISLPSVSFFPDAPLVCLLCLPFLSLSPPFCPSLFFAPPFADCCHSDCRSAMWKNSLTKYGWVLCISYAHMTFRHGGSLFLFLCPSPSSSFAESVLMHRVRATSLRPSSTFLNAFNPLKEYIQ